MAVRLEMRVRHEGCASERFTDGTVLMQVSGERDAENTYVLHAPGEAELERALAIAEASADNEADVLASTPTSMVFRGRNQTDGVVSTIHQSGSTILFPIVYRDGLEFYTLVAPDRNVAGGLVKALEAHGDVEVERVHEIAPDELEAQLPLAGLVAELTPRQLALLQLAKREGYYELPKRTGAAELAEQAGVTRSTLSEHLRKAEARVIERFVELVERYPSLQTDPLERPDEGESPP